MVERFLRLVEEPHVLDRDHRLVGENLEQLDLLLRERSNLLAADVDRPRAAVPRGGAAWRAPFGTRSRLAFAQPSGYSVSSAVRSSTWIVRRSSAARPFTVLRSRGRPLPDCQRRNRPAMLSGQPQHVAVDAEDHRVRCVAQPRGGPGNRVEHRLDVGGRARDDTEDVGGRRLLLERFGELTVARLQLLEQPHVLDRNRRLIRRRFRAA